MDKGVSGNPHYEGLKEATVDSIRQLGDTPCQDDVLPDIIHAITMVVQRTADVNSLYTEIRKLMPESTKRVRTSGEATAIFHKQWNGLRHERARLESLFRKWSENQDRLYPGWPDQPFD